MSTLTADSSGPVTDSHTSRWSLPLPLVVVASRLLVLAGAVVGTTVHRVAGWQLADPQHLTLKLGSLGNVLAAAGVRWDSVHYLAIAAHGYNTPSNTVFFPLYPALIKAFSWLTGSYVLAGALISAVAFATALLLLYRLTRAELGDRAANATVLLLAFSPLSLFFTALYTESLFLALVLGVFLLARQRRFGWAGVAAAAATMTHVEGVLLIAPLAMFYWQERRPVLKRPSSLRQALGPAGDIASLLSPVIALCGFLIYLHSRGFGWLAPSTDERYYSHHFSGPITGVADGVSAGVSGLGHMITGSAGALTARQDAFENVVYLVVLVTSVTALVVAWRQLPKAYAVYSGLCLLVCVSSPVTAEPLTSLDRYVLVVFPLWMVAARWLSRRRLLRLTLAGSSTLLFVFALQFARWAFIG
jgi:hypothetical protein